MKPCPTNVGPSGAVKRVPEALELELAGKTVRVTSPDKVFFTKRGETKLDLIDYYIAVAEPMMGVVGGRPALMQRFPDGASGKSFWQKRVPKGAPEWLETTEVSTPNGTTSQAIVLADIAHVVWAAHMGSLCFHVWPYPAAAARYRRRTTHRSGPARQDHLR